MLGEKQATINERNKEIKQLKLEVADLIKYKKDDKRLLRSLQDLHFATLKLTKAEVEVVRLKDSLSNLHLENQKLNQKIIEVSKNFEAEKTARMEYEKKLDSILKHEGKELVNQEAKRNAQLDDEAGREKSAYSMENKMEALLFPAIGYKYPHGITFEMAYGLTVNTDKSIFLGIGSGYDYLFKDKLSMIPVFFSAKATLPEGFVIYDKDGKHFNDPYNSVVVTMNVGYSFVLESYKQNVSSGGPFLHFAIGMIEDGGTTMAVIPELSYRLQHLNKLGESGLFENTLQHTVALKVGLGILLGR
jgi:hypothetical protein